MCITLTAQSSTLTEWQQRTQLQLRDSLIPISERDAKPEFVRSFMVTSFLYSLVD